MGEVYFGAVPIMKKFLMSALLVALATDAATASDQIKVCTRYYRSTYSSWSAPYRSTAYLMSGTELNQTVNSAAFNAKQQYIVISWKKDNDYSAIRLPEN